MTLRAWGVVVALVVLAALFMGYRHMDAIIASERLRAASAKASADQLRIQADVADALKDSMLHEAQAAADRAKAADLRAAKAEGAAAALRARVVVTPGAVADTVDGVPVEVPAVVDSLLIAQDSAVRALRADVEAGKAENARLHLAVLAAQAADSLQHRRADSLEVALSATNHALTVATKQPKLGFTAGLGIGAGATLLLIAVLHSTVK
jgi:hypothetical protein